MKLFSLLSFSLNTLLEEFFHLDPSLFFHIFLIFLEMKANSSSSLDSSLEELSTLSALGVTLDDDLDEDSLDNGVFFAFLGIESKTFSLLNSFIFLKFFFMNL